MNETCEWDGEVGETQCREGWMSDVESSMKRVNEMSERVRRVGVG